MRGFHENWRRLWLRAFSATLAAVILLAIATPARALERVERKLLDLSLEDLSSLEVDSVAGIGQSWFRTPAELHVLTGEEVRRSGHQTIAESLRMVPGMFVGRRSVSNWSVGARGFNGFGNKQLVLIDGRTVYDPLFSNTFWDVQDVLLEDLDRIEVINGPGATLWGANAVNGVISVTTRSAKETQGLYLTGLAGTELRGLGAVRYGGRLSDDGWFRVWGKFLNYDDLARVDDDDGADDSDYGRGGFRMDIEGADGFTLMFQAEMYGTDRIGERVRLPVPGAHAQFNFEEGDGRAEGGHVLLRLAKDLGDGAGWALQAYYDRSERAVQGGFEFSRDTAEIDFRHHFQFAQQHSLIWGAAVRHTSDRTDAGPMIRLDPENRSLDTFSAFIQSTFTLVPDKLFFMVGSKFEDNDTSGFEFQPSVRLWLTPDDNQTLWFGASRPIRSPSRFEEDLRQTAAFVDTGLIAGMPATGVFVPIGVRGDPDNDAEEITVIEGGYRVRLGPAVTVDAAVFWNKYEDLLFVPTGTLVFSNDGSAETYGATVSGTWQVAENWRLVGSYSFTDVQVHGPIFNTDEGNTPHHMAQIRSYLNITPDIELNAALYYVDSVPTPDVDAYLRLDVGMTFRLSENVELSIWGQNLLDPQHREFTDTEVERGVYAQLKLRF